MSHRGPVPISYDARARVWTLEAPFSYSDGGTLIHIPQGFTFDLASVPRAFWRVIAPFELSVEGALVHDWLYRNGGAPPYVMPYRTFSREEADRLFGKIMEDEGVPGWRRALAYRAVRWFGGRAWKAPGWWYREIRRAA